MMRSIEEFKDIQLCISLDILENMATELANEQDSFRREKLLETMIIYIEGMKEEI